MRFRITSLFLAATMLDAMAQQASCSFSEADVGTDAGTNDADSGSFFATASYEFPEHRGTHGRGQAQAGFGHVNAFAEAYAYGTPQESNRLVIEAHAFSSYDDILISPLAQSRPRR